MQPRRLWPYSLQLHDHELRFFGDSIWYRRSIYIRLVEGLIDTRFQLDAPRRCTYKRGNTSPDRITSLVLAYGPHSTEDLARERIRWKCWAWHPNSHRRASMATSVCAVRELSLFLDEIGLTWLGKVDSIDGPGAEDWIFILGLSVEK